MSSETFGFLPSVYLLDHGDFGIDSTSKLFRYGKTQERESNTAATWRRFVFTSHL